MTKALLLEIQSFKADVAVITIEREDILLYLTVITGAITGASIGAEYAFDPAQLGELNVYGAARIIAEDIVVGSVVSVPIGIALRRFGRFLRKNVEDHLAEIEQQYWEQVREMNRIER